MLRPLVSAITLSLFVAFPSFASELEKPTGAAILTVSGNVAITNNDDVAEFDFDMLEALGKTTFETTTIWTEGTEEFEGVSLSVLANVLGLEGEMLRATAINDYAVDIPLSDAVEGGPIVAYRMNGKTMSVRNKGPLWIVYPYDSEKEYRTEVIYSRSIWQLDRIEVRD